MTKEIIEKYIAVNPKIQHGRPCIKGTRTPVYVILEALASGMNVEEVKGEYGPVSAEAVRACILYAALLADEQELLSEAAA